MCIRDRDTLILMTKPALYTLQFLLYQYCLLYTSRQSSPVIVQVSQKEMKRYGSTCGQFADEYRRCIREMDIRVPAALHLDHTKDLDIIQAAIDAGFDSVMIDASEQPCLLYTSRCV